MTANIIALLLVRLSQHNFSWDVHASQYNLASMKLRLVQTKSWIFIFRLRIILFSTEAFAYRLKYFILIIMSETAQEPKPQTDCIICLQLADEAVVSKCCVTLMCLKCYQKVKDLPNGCPNCRAQKPTFICEPQSFIRKFIVEVSPEIQFSVVLINGQKMTLRMRTMETAKMLYNRVSERCGAPVEQLRLMVGTKVIKRDEKSLRYNQLADNLTVLQLLTMIGG